MTRELTEESKTDLPLNKKPINYKPEHYRTLMKGKVKETDMDIRITENLNMMDNILVKVVILLAGLVLLIFNTLMYAKRSISGNYAALKAAKTVVKSEEVEEKVISQYAIKEHDFSQKGLGMLYGLGCILTAAIIVVSDRIEKIIIEKSATVSLQSK